MSCQFCGGNSEGKFISVVGDLKLNHSPVQPARRMVNESMIHSTEAFLYTRLQSYPILFTCKTH